MKELTANEIQNVCLSMLKHIHAFCVKNDIRYSLGYGSLIGAIRHDGFIPWDDDADLIMPRPDYDKFIQLYQDSEDYKLLAPEKGNSHKTYMRLCEMKKTTSKVLLPWHEGPVGVWIDIFPIDGVAEDEFERDKDNTIICKLNEDLCRYRQGLLNFSLNNGFKLNFKIIVFRMLGKVFFWESLQKKVQEQMKIHPFSKSQYCGNLGFVGYIKKEKLPRHSFKHYELHKFEDTELFIISEYDLNLRNYYGDYMTPPPPEKRVLKHNNEQKFYWTER